MFMSHSDSNDEDDDDVELVGNGWREEFLTDFTYILLRNFAKWLLEPNF